MSGYVTGMKVPPLGRRDLRAFARAIHGHLRYNGEGPFPIMIMLEHVLPALYQDFEYEICSKDQLGIDHGMTYPDKHRILLREDVYEGACDGRGRDRYTVAHEISHLLLHEGLGVRLMREDVPHKAFEDSEWQANALAGEILMPYESIVNLDANAIASRYQVSLAAAKTQLRATHR